jgi:hypothetical protein
MEPFRWLASMSLVVYVGRVQRKSCDKISGRQFSDHSIPAWQVPVGIVYLRPIPRA